MGARLTPLATGLSALAIAAVSTTGWTEPLASWAKEIHLRIRWPLSFHSLPRNATTSLPSMCSAAVLAVSTSTSVSAGWITVAIAGTRTSAGASSRPTTVSAAEAAAVPLNERPVWAGIVYVPSVPLTIWASTGARSSRDRASSTRAASAAGSNTRVGWIVWPWRARRIWPRARSAVVPSRPARSAASAIAPVSTWRPNCAYGTDTSPASVSTTTRPVVTAS